MALGQDGTWVWTASSNGRFSLSSAWNIVRQSSLFELANIEWFPCHSPKMACCLLSALNEGLLTADRLKNSIIDQDLCHLESETIHHLFFSCPYSAYIWSLCKLKLRINPSIHSLQQEALNIKEGFNKKTKSFILARLVLGGAVWHIWKEQNSRIFQHKMQHKI